MRLQIASILQATTDLQPTQGSTDKDINDYLERTQLKPKLMQFLGQVDLHLNLCTSIQIDLVGDVVRVCMSQMLKLINENLS